MIALKDGGKINLLATDTQRVVDMFGRIDVTWAAPLTIVIAQYFLWQYLGHSSLAGLAAIALLISAESLLSRKLKQHNYEIMKQKDKRIKMTNEVINGIKSIKVNAWERGFLGKIEELRGAEINVMTKVSLISAFNGFLVTATPFVAALSSFAAFVLSDPENNLMTAEVAFVSLGYYDVLRKPLKMIQEFVTAAVEAIVSMNRINEFLQVDECRPPVNMKIEKNIRNGCHRSFSSF